MKSFKEFRGEPVLNDPKDFIITSMDGKQVLTAYDTPFKRAEWSKQTKDARRYSKKRAQDLARTVKGKVEPFKT